MAKRKPPKEGVSKRESRDATRVQVELVSPRDMVARVADQTTSPDADAPLTETGINAVYELAECTIISIWALREDLKRGAPRLGEVWFPLAQAVEELNRHPQRERVRKLLPLRRMLLGSGIPITSTSLNVVMLCVKLTGEITDAAIRDFPWQSVDEPNPQFWPAVLRGLMRMPTLELGSFLDDLHLERTCAIAALAKADKVSECVYLGGGRLVADGTSITLESAESDVIETLVQDRTCDLPTLIFKSHQPKAARLLKRIINKHGFLKPYIKLPGGRGKGGYSTTIIKA